MFAGYPSYFFQTPSLQTRQVQCIVRIYPFNSMIRQQFCILPGNRSACGLAFKYAGEDFCLVGLFAGGRDFSLAGFPSVQISLDVRGIQKQPTGKPLPWRKLILPTA